MLFPLFILAGNASDRLRCTTSSLSIDAFMTAIIEGPLKRCGSETDVWGILRDSDVVVGGADLQGNFPYATHSLKMHHSLLTLSQVLV